MSSTLSPTAQAVLDSLAQHGPASAAELRDQVGRSRSAIDKALAEVSKAGLVNTSEGTDVGTPGARRWQVAIDNDAPTGTDAGPGGEDADQESGVDGLNTGPSESASNGTPSGEDTPDSADDVKLCRGCQNQMARICPCCAGKTTAYCAECRRNHPTRRRLPGETVMLANGLPKLTRGELERLVVDVMTTHAIPEHLGITGWTPGRIAIYLPGRSSGAIANALDKLTTLGRARLIGDSPKRYVPEPDADLEVSDTQP